MLAQQDAAAGLAGPEQIAVMPVQEAADDMAVVTDVADIAPPTQPESNAAASDAQDDDEPMSDSASDSASDADANDGEMPSSPKNQGDDVPLSKDKGETASTDSASDDASPRKDDSSSVMEGQEEIDLQAAQYYGGGAEGHPKDFCCKEAIPLLEPSTATTVMVLNIFLPGVGSLVAAANDPNGCNAWCTVFGVLQILLTVVFAGWLWSVIFGVMIHQYSKELYNKDGELSKDPVSGGEDDSNSGRESAAN